MVVKKPETKDAEKTAKNEAKEMAEAEKVKAVRESEDPDLSDKQAKSEMRDDAIKAVEMSERDKMLSGHGAEIPERATSEKYRTDVAARAADAAILPHPNPEYKMKHVEKVEKENLDLMLRKPTYDKKIKPGEQVPLQAANIGARATDEERAEKRRKVVEGAVSSAMKKVPI